MKRIESEQSGKSTRDGDQSHLTLLHTLKGHEDTVRRVAWSPDGRVLASGSSDDTIRLWDGQTRRHLSTLEGHTDCISGISFSSNGHLIASKSDDGTVRIWLTASWEMVEILNEESSRLVVFGIAFHPHAPILATLGENDTVVRIWNVDVAALLGIAPATASVHYTTAKIALVGDSAVGKSGLGYRIAEDRFQITESTHGQQFWPDVSHQPREMVGRDKVRLFHYTEW